jgi:hypothetical protein
MKNLGRDFKIPYVEKEFCYARFEKKELKK